MIGRCKYYNHEREYGFIAIDQTSADFFYHLRNVIGTPPQRGDSVEFWLDDNSGGRPGWQAVEVEVIQA